MRKPPAELEVFHQEAEKLEAARMGETVRRRRGCGSGAMRLSTDTRWEFSVLVAF